MVHFSGVPASMLCTAVSAPQSLAPSSLVDQALSQLLNSSNIHGFTANMFSAQPQTMIKSSPSSSASPAADGGGCAVCGDKVCES